MALNKEEDTPIDVARGFADLREMVTDQHTQMAELRESVAEISESVRLLTININQGAGRVEGNRAVGFAQRRPLDLYRDRAEGFAQGQPGKKTIVKQHPRRVSDSEHSRSEGFYCADDDFSTFQVKPIIPNFHGYCHPENFIYWFRKVDKFFEYYTGVSEEEEVEFVAPKLQGHASRW